MKKLSVIVPCYNVGQYIDRCVESLTSQTLDKSQYEIILVDDASLMIRGNILRIGKTGFLILLLQFIVMLMVRWDVREISG